MAGERNYISGGTVNNLLNPQDGFASSGEIIDKGDNITAVTGEEPVETPAPAPSPAGTALTPAQTEALTFVYNKVLAATQGPKPSVHLSNNEAKATRAVSGGQVLNPQNPDISPTRLTSMLMLFRLLSKRGALDSVPGLRLNDLTIIRSLAKKQNNPKLSLSRFLLNRPRRAGMYAELNASPKPAPAKRQTVRYIVGEERTEALDNLAGKRSEDPTILLDPALSKSRAAKRRIFRLKNRHSLLEYEILNEALRAAQSHPQPTRGARKRRGPQAPTYEYGGTG